MAIRMFALNSSIKESIPAYNISLSVKQVNLYETLFYNNIFSKREREREGGGKGMGGEKGKGRSEDPDRKEA